MHRATLYLRMLALLLLVTTGLTSLMAQTTAKPVYEPQFFDKLKWRNIGPNRGGRSLGCTGSPGRPNEYYFGATGGGLW